MKMLKKMTAMFLISVMLLSTLPLNSLALATNPIISNAAQSDKDETESASNEQAQGTSNSNTSDAVLSDTDNPNATGNSLALGESNPNAREQLIAALAEQYGPENSEAMFDSMVAMGIVDENGNRLTYKIEMDGKLYTLDQMGEIVNVPGVDLTKEVKVDDKVVTLAFISQLINFEKYLQFVEDNFLKNQAAVTDEHLKMLADLENQLNTEGISLVEGTSENAAISDTDSDAVVEYSLGAITANNTLDITYTLTGGGADAQVTFSQECLSGVLDADAITTTSSAITTTSAAITLTSDSRTATVTLNLPDVENVLWKGAAELCYVRLYDLYNGLFSNGKSSQLVPITKNSDYHFTSYKPTINILTNPIPTNNLDGWTVKNGKYNNGDFGGEIKGNPSSTVNAWQEVELNADAISLAANGELTASASGFFWGQAASTIKAFLKAEFYNKDRVSLASKKVECDRYDWGGENNETLSFSGYTVPTGTTYMRFEVQNNNSLTRGPSMRDFSLNLTDSKAPTVKAIS